MNKLTFLLLLFALLACSQPKEHLNQQTIAIDFDIDKKSVLGPEDIECVFIPLETKEECLLATAFEDIQFVDDRIFIINYQNNSAQVFVFSKEGKFITRIGNLGQGPGEYQQPYKLHINKTKNVVTIADRHVRILTHYDLYNYQYISREVVPFSFSDCIWLDDQHILWYDEGGIDTGKRKRYCAGITNEKMEFVSTLQETKPFGYVIGHTSLYNYGNHAFVGLPFSPFIYQMDVEKTTPVWELSFGKQMLPPQSLVVDEREDNMGWQTKVMNSDYIIAFHAHETSDWLGVSFYGKSFMRHLGFYDKRTKTTHAYTATEFMYRFHLYGIYDIINTHNDYFVARAEPLMLKKYIPQREDLRRIAEKMTEEDNPVICLFKFK